METKKQPSKKEIRLAKKQTKQKYEKLIHTIRYGKKGAHCIRGQAANMRSCAYCRLIDKYDLRCSKCCADGKCLQISDLWGGLYDAKGWKEEALKICKLALKLNREIMP